MKRALATALLLAAALLAGASAPPDTSGIQQPPPPEAFAIVSREPVLELRFRGPVLRKAESDTSQNALSLSFNGAVDDSTFEALQAMLPDWIDSAYAGYDDAVIRARRPVTFQTKAETDGFSLRMVPAGQQVAQADIPPPPPQRMAPPQPMAPSGTPALRRRIDESGVGAWQFERRLTTTAASDGGAALRGQYDLARRHFGSSVEITEDYRRIAGATLASAGLRGAIAIDSGWRIVGGAAAVQARGRNVRRLDGTTQRLDTRMLSGSLGLGFRTPNDGDLRLEALYSPAGPGGRLAYDETAEDGDWSASAEYHVPWFETAEAVAAHGVRDRLRVGGTASLGGGFWVSAAGSVSRYGVRGDDDIARTAGFAASLRYAAEIFGASAGLAYDVQGEYVLASQKYLDASLNPFTPMDIRTREIHSATASLGIPLDDGLWFDLYGGYAYDRYGERGGFGGGAVRWLVAPGWEFAIGGAYTQVSAQQGVRGSETSAGLTLSYQAPNG